MRRIVKASKITTTKSLIDILPSPIVRYAEYMPGPDRLATNQNIDVVADILERQGGFAVGDIDYHNGTGKTIYLHRGDTEIALYASNNYLEDSFIELSNADREDSVYRVYFVDSNQKLLQGRNMSAIIEYIEDSSQYSVDDIVKIENVDWYK